MLIYDVIIAGGGPAGLTAGLYCARSRLNSLLLEKLLPGGKLAITSTIENYPGFPQGISGMELASRMKEQGERFGLELEIQEVKRVEDISAPVKVVITEEKKYHSHALIIATGSRMKKLGIPGEGEFIGKGVSYCASCDAPFFRDKPVLVIGGGDTAIKEALYLTGFASQVFLLHRRDRLRATRVEQEKALRNPRLKFLWDSIPLRIVGKELVEGVTVKNLKSGEIREIPVGGVFIFVGTIPNTEFVQSQVETTSSGHILTDEEMRASVKGVFACGDCRKRRLDQVSTAVGEGAIAGFSAYEYVAALKGETYP